VKVHEDSHVSKLKPEAETSHYRPPLWNFVFGNISDADICTTFNKLVKNGVSETAEWSKSTRITSEMADGTHSGNGYW